VLVTALARVRAEIEILSRCICSPVDVAVYVGQSIGAVSSVIGRHCWVLTLARSGTWSRVSAGLLGGERSLPCYLWWTTAMTLTRARAMQRGMCGACGRLRVRCSIAGRTRLMWPIDDEGPSFGFSRSWTWSVCDG
jgi:hypothetical protein